MVPGILDALVPPHLKGTNVTYSSTATTIMTPSSSERVTAPSAAPATEESGAADAAKQV